MTRRTVLAAPFLIGCGRQLAPRSSGWLFVASATDRGIGVADLASFHRVTTIPLPDKPGQVLQAGGRVFVSCPEARALCEIDPQGLRVTGRIQLAGVIVGCAVTPGGDRIVVVTDQPAAILSIDPASRRVVTRLPLDDQPIALDAAKDLVAVSTARGSLVRASLSEGKVLGATPLGMPCKVVRFRPDGKSILLGAASGKQMMTVDAASGQLLARLPLALVPARFCFTSNDNGGQMFVTGEGEDSIVIVSPYQSEVDQTIVAGRTPFGLATGVIGGQNLLFVTNPGSGDLTIFDIDTRRLAASVHVGGNPGEVLLTPDQDYALVINRDSGDVAVVRLSTVLDHKVKTKPLFTVFPTAASPQSAAIIPKGRA
ncbi:MAG TPA: YncE family protein [Bryobacteraceae bacterium]|nr:YncE family protein [Bryobacteraceae bacterium]